MKLECRRKQLLLQPATQLAEAVPPGVHARLFRRKGVRSGHCTSKAVGFCVLRFGGREVATWYPTTAKPSQIGVAPSCLALRAETRLINEYGVAFFERYLTELPQPLLDRKNSELAACEFRPTE